MDTGLPVSIHAPAWGATRTLCPRCEEKEQFQSTRPRGARLMPLKSSPCNIYRFNPRARVGRDKPADGKPVGSVAFQSTRPRGARRYFQYQSRSDTLFQSTRPRGARHSGNDSIRVYRWFQSTRPRGARLYAFQLYALHKNNSIELRKFKI